jgi:hypothetical protein
VEENTAVLIALYSDFALYGIHLALPSPRDGCAAPIR